MLIPVLRGLRWDLVSCLGVLLCSSLSLTYSSEKEKKRKRGCGCSFPMYAASVCLSLA